MCEKIELEEQSSLVEDLAHIPTESKDKQVRQYLQSLPVTTSTSVGNIAFHPQASQAPVLTTTSTPKSTTCGLRASAPSFPTGAVTQIVYAGHYLEHHPILTTNVRKCASFSKNGATQTSLSPQANIVPKQSIKIPHYNHHKTKKPTEFHSPSPTIHKTLKSKI